MRKCSLRTLLELFADELCSLADTVATPTDNFPEIATENCKSPCIHLNSNAKNGCFDSLIITYVHRFRCLPASEATRIQPARGW